MAVSKEGKRQRIGPSLRGLIYQYERNGQHIAAKMPPKRGKYLSDEQRIAGEAFREVVKAMKLTNVYIQMYHRWNAEGTPMLPRDSLMAALYGRGGPLWTYSGKVIKSMSNKIDVSIALDAIAWDQNDMLFRSANYWHRLPGGPAGRALCVADNGIGFQWNELPSTNGPGQYLWPTSGGLSTSNNKFKGLHFNALFGWSIRSVTFIHDAAIDDHIDLSFLYIDESGTIQSIERHLPSVAIGDGDEHLVTVEIGIPFVCPPQQRVALLLSTEGKVASFATRIWTGTASNANQPLLGNFGFINRAAASLNIGDTLTLATQNPYFLGMKIA